MLHPNVGFNAGPVNDKQTYLENRLIRCLDNSH